MLPLQDDDGNCAFCTAVVRVVAFASVVIDSESPTFRTLSARPCTTGCGNVTVDWSDGSFPILLNTLVLTYSNGFFLSSCRFIPILLNTLVLTYSNGFFLSSCRFISSSSSFASRFVCASSCALSPAAM